MVWELKSLHRTDFSKAGLFRELGQLLKRWHQPLIILPYQHPYGELIVRIVGQGDYNTEFSAL